MVTLFEAPAGVAPVPSEIVRRAEISGCGQYRWTLTRTWRAGPHVCWIGLNPSTADHRIDDPTARRWTHFAHAWGYGGWVAVNLYPFRSPNPAACRRWAASDDAAFVIQHNVEVIALAASRSALIVACWGALPWDERHAEMVAGRILTLECRRDLHCLGTTASGAPKHPMARGVHRVPDDQQPLLWGAA